MGLTIMDNSISEIERLEQKALAFLSEFRDQFASFSIVFEGSFALEWRTVDGHRGWLDAKGQEGKYQVDGDDRTVMKLLDILSILHDEVIFVEKKP